MIDAKRTERVFRVISERRYVSAEDLMQLGDIGVPVYQRLADRLGVPVSEIKGLAERRELKPEDVRAVVTNFAAS